MLGTLLVEPPPSLAAIVRAGGAVDLSWGASPSAASRTLEYVVLRRPLGAPTFGELGRTSGLTFADAPPAGSYEYAVRTVISTFTSALSPIATATTGP